MMKNYIAIIVFTLLVAFKGNSQDRISGFNFAIDEDFFVKLIGLNNQDRNYTLGFHLSFFNSNWNSYLANLMKIKSNKEDLLPSEISLDAVAFSPNIISKPEIQHGDRPYANVLFLSLKRHGLNKNIYNSKTLYVGLMGTRIAEFFQSTIHRWVNSPDPKGWNNQISDGGEITLMYTRKKLKLMIDNQSFQLNHGYTYNLGYLVNAGYNLGLRWGKIDRSQWIDDMSGFIGSTSAKKSNRFHKENHKEYYAYANLNSNVNLYNASLHGQFRSSNYIVPYSKTGFVTFEVTLGAAFSLGNLMVSTYYKFRSPEIWDSNYKYIHDWMGLSVSSNF